MARRKKTKRRRWFQFSLRSVLLLTVVASVVLMIYRPDPPGGRTLSDGWTIFEQTTEQLISFSNPVTNTIDHIKEGQRHGRFIVRDASGRKRVDGFFADGEPTSLWRVYHPNGRKAMEGQCSQGVPTDKWIAWYPNRVKAAELSFREPDRLESQIGDRQLKQPIAMPRREGFAAFRDIHDECVGFGEYRDDQRDGTWTTEISDTDASEIDYLAGLRHDPQAGRILGHRIHDWTVLLKKLEADMTSGDRQQQVRAVQMLRHCGAEGIVLARRYLTSDDRYLKLLLCGGVAEIGPPAFAAEPELQQLASSDDDAFAVAALLALAAIGSQQDARIKRLMQIAATAENDRRQQIVLRASRLDSSTVPVLDRLVSDSDEQLRRCAFQSLVAILYDALGSRKSDRFERIAAVIKVFDKAKKHPQDSIAEAATDVLRLYDEGRLRVDLPGGNQFPGWGCVF